MAGENTYKESDGKAVDVYVTAAVDSEQLIYAENWLGITTTRASVSTYVPIDIRIQEYQLTVPSSLSVSKGQIIYIDTAQVTNHIPADAAYSTSAGAGRIAAFKATAAKDSNNVVLAVFIGGLGLLS